MTRLQMREVRGRMERRETAAGLELCRWEEGERLDGEKERCNIVVGVTGWRCNWSSDWGL
jgi:hypothetical protein